MTSGSSRLSALLCEGRDDVAAIRGLLSQRGAVKRGEELRRVSRPGATAPEHWSLDRSTLIVQSVGGKDKLAEAALDFALGTSSERPGRIIICFDPDEDPPAREFEFLLEAVRRAKQSGQTERVGEDWKIRARDRDLLLTPAPWRAAEGSSFDHLPDHHCLERILIAALRNSAIDDSLKRWTEETTSELANLVSNHGWKRAFRIWSAAVDPRSESFVDRLLGRDDTKLACLSALRASPVNAAIELALSTS